MIWKGPLFMPMWFPLGLFCVHFPSGSGICKVPVGLINSQSVSMLLVVLSFWLFQYMFIFNRIQQGSLFHILVIMLLWCVQGFFCTKNMMVLYALFELSLVPTLFIIFMFGYQPEKLVACLYFALYTVVCSIPFFLLVIWSPKSIFLFYVSNPTLPLVMAFLVKTPLYLFHIWLPKAHVEAPVSGSMVLASVLLKLGSYGLLLFAIDINNSTVMTMVLWISILGMVSCGFSCMRSNDLKSLVAYSSVSHMAVVTMGVVVGTKISLLSSLMMMIAHGLTSPMMFAVCNSLYMSSHSRTILLNKGLNSVSLLGFSLVFILSTNLAVPPSINLWSEMYVMMSIISTSALLSPFFMVFLFIGLAYNLYIYTSTFHGKQSKMYKSSNLMEIKSLCSGPLWCFLLFMSEEIFYVFYY
uniref:NADH-ubiquinone oxidoreductase chain 4 n=1 Tax=Spadella cephaloptera TaxID=52888 RepID=A0A141CKF7_9BILA|nr:NADH dehydrogenase subunit 4 [Spadella cephaloptera]